MKPVKSQKPCCPRCRHKGYDQGAAPGDGRPAFTCQSCFHYWTSGKTGGPYAKKEVGAMQ